MKKIAAIAVMGLICAAVTNAAYLCTIETRVESGPAAGHKVVVNVVADGDRARFEFVQGGQVSAKDGYILTTDGGRTLYLVNTAEKTYTAWDRDQIMATVSEITKSLSGLVDMQFSNIKCEKLEEDAGPEMVGMKTRYYKFHSSYDMDVTVFGMRNTTSVSQDQEFWTTEDMGGETLGGWMRGSVMKTENAELDKLIAAETQEVSGIPLKIVVDRTAKDSQGKVQTTKSVTEVTRLEKGEGGVSLEFPEGYKKTSMMPEESDSSATGKEDGRAAEFPLLKLLRGRK